MSKLGVLHIKTSVKLFFSMPKYKHTGMQLYALISPV